MEICERPLLKPVLSLGLSFLIIYWYCYNQKQSPDGARTLVLQKYLLEGPLCLALWVIYVIINSNKFSRQIDSALHLRKDIETVSHYLLHCHYFANERSTLLNSIKEIGPINLTKGDCFVTNTLVFDNSSLLQKWILTS